MHCIDKAKLGYIIGGRCASVFAYADDLIILSCSVTKLQLLLNLCDIIFNPDQSLCGFIGDAVLCAKLVLAMDNAQLKWIRSSN